MLSTASQSFLNLACLVDKGYVTDAQRDNIAQIATNLPNDTVGLLKALVATSINNIGSTGFTTNPPLATDSVTTDDTTPEPFPTPPAGAKRAIVTPHGNSIIFTLNGDDPTPTSGHYIPEHENVEIPNIENFKFIAADGSAAVNLYVAFYA